MIHMTSSTRILLATQPADFRKGIDGFDALCRLALKEDSRSGTHFVFINRSRTMVRILSYDGTGFWLSSKRLCKGKFQGWPRQGETINAMSAVKLGLLLQGAPTSRVKLKNAA